MPRVRPVVLNFSPFVERIAVAPTTLRHVNILACVAPAILPAALVFAGRIAGAKQNRREPTWAILPSMTLEETIAAMYASFSFDEGARPNWALQAEIFAPGA
ncbi:MAG TPA: hypothetical protein VGJ82_03530, partial [Thermoanaerobaculia bacterium]